MKLKSSLKVRIWESTSIQWIAGQKGRNDKNKMKTFHPFMLVRWVNKVRFWVEWEQLCGTFFCDKLKPIGWSRAQSQREKEEERKEKKGGNVRWYYFSQILGGDTQHYCVAYCMKTYSLAMAAKRPPLSQVKSQLSRVWNQNSCWRGWEVPVSVECAGVNINRRTTVPETKTRTTGCALVPNWWAIMGIVIFPLKTSLGFLYHIPLGPVVVKWNWELAL